MTDEPDNLTLRHRRWLDETVDRLADAASDLSVDGRGIESHVAGFGPNEAAPSDALASIKVRIGRRLDLQEPRP